MPQACCPWTHSVRDRGFSSLRGHGEPVTVDRWGIFRGRTAWRRVPRWPAGSPEGAPSLPPEDEAASSNWFYGWVTYLPTGSAASFPGSLGGPRVRAKTMIVYPSARWYSRRRGGQMSSQRFAVLSLKAFGERAAKAHTRYVDQTTVSGSSATGRWEAVQYLRPDLPRLRLRRLDQAGADVLGRGRPAARPGPAGVDSPRRHRPGAHGRDGRLTPNQANQDRNGVHR